MDEAAITARLDAQTDEERAAFIEELRKAEFFGGMKRWTAVAGPSMLPVLRAMTAPNMNFNSMPGEAQICLAKLSDENALAELEKEVNGTRTGGYAIEKLIEVGTDRSISLLAGFLRAHIHDEWMRQNYGDYETDLRGRAAAGMVGLFTTWDDDVAHFPAIMGHPYQDVLDWWDQRQGKVTFSISENVNDPYVACLARKVEWGFPEAIVDMADSGHPQVIPILKRLQHMGPGGYTLNTIRGRARFALAKLGDEEALSAIEQAAYDYGAGLEMLWRIGGKRAVNTLVAALDSSFPRETYLTNAPPSPKDKRNYAWYQKSLAEHKNETYTAILNTLNTMVVNPPQLTGNVEARKKQWKDWWAKNKDTAQFVIPPAGPYE